MVSYINCVSGSVVSSMSFICNQKQGELSSLLPFYHIKGEVQYVKHEIFPRELSHIPPKMALLNLESMIFPTSRLVGYVSIPWRVSLIDKSSHYPSSVAPSPLLSFLFLSSLLLSTAFFWPRKNRLLTCKSTTTAQAKSTQINYPP